MIRLAAQNLATDNTYILPEEDGDEIYYDEDNIEIVDKFENQINI